MSALVMFPAKPLFRPGDLHNNAGHQGEEKPGPLRMLGPHPLHHAEPRGPETETGCDHGGNQGNFNRSHGAPAFDNDTTDHGVLMLRSSLGGLRAMVNEPFQCSADLIAPYH